MLVVVLFIGELLPTSGISSDAHVNHFTKLAGVLLDAGEALEARNEATRLPQLLGDFTQGDRMQTLHLRGDGADSIELHTLHILQKQQQLRSLGNEGVAQFENVSV